MPLRASPLLPSKPSLDLVGVLLVDEALELCETFAGDDHTASRERRKAVAERAVDIGEAVTIGGDHAQLAGVSDPLDEDAVQVVAGLVGRGRVHRALDHLGEHRGRRGRKRLGREVRKGGVLLGGRSRERELSACAAQREIGVARRLQMDLLFRKLAHDLVELARGDGQPARLRNFTRMRAADADLEIGGRELEGAILALATHLEQRVGQDRHRVALLDDRLDPAEAALELALIDRELHGCVPLAERRMRFSSL